MDATTFKQEMPPIGGYRPLHFERILAKKFLTLPKCLFAVIAGKIIWIVEWKRKSRLNFARTLEHRSSNNALEPCLIAEKDREYIRQLRRNRDEEADLMKNVPGWEVGTLYGVPLFKTLPPEQIVNPSTSEYYIHTRIKFLFELYHFEFRR